jgi:hypothetical protein
MHIAHFLPPKEISRADLALVLMQSRTEAKILATHTLREMPNTKFALFYQNDDFGKNFVNGLRDVLGDRYSSTVQAVAYELTDPTVDSRVVTLPRPTSDRRKPRRGHRHDHATRTVRLSKTTCCCDNRYMRADPDLVCINGRRGMTAALPRLSACHDYRCCFSWEFLDLRVHTSCTYRPPTDRKT